MCGPGLIRGSICDALRSQEAQSIALVDELPRLREHHPQDPLQRSCLEAGPHVAEEFLEHGLFTRWVRGRHAVRSLPGADVPAQHGSFLQHGTQALVDRVHRRSVAGQFVGAHCGACSSFPY